MGTLIESNVLWMSRKALTRCISIVLTWSFFDLPFHSFCWASKCAKLIQVQGCILDPKKAKSSLATPSTNNNSGTSAAGVTADSGGGKGKSYDDLKQERDNLRDENAELKREIERLQANALKSGSSKLQRMHTQKVYTSNLSSAKDDVPEITIVSHSSGKRRRSNKWASKIEERTDGYDGQRAAAKEAQGR
jgi:hypothetical protein